MAPSTVTPDSNLNSPSLTLVSFSKNRVDLSWNSVTGATAYEVWSSINGAAFQNVATTSSTSYQDSPGANKNVGYYVIAYTSSSRSSKSNTVYAST
jgi:hypothetical protein